VIDPEPFRRIADSVGALLLFDAAHIAGLIAGGAHPNPVPFSDIVSFTTHKTLRGPRGGCIVSKEAFAQPIDKAVFPGMQGGPLMHTITAKAVCFEEALKPSFKEYNKQIVKNAKVLAETLMNNGIRLVSGGTDNHLMLIDLTNQHLTGLEAEVALGKAAITVNKNTIPNETKSPFVTSGLRVGTPAVTSRGMKEAEMRQIGTWISAVVKDIKNETLIQKVNREVTTMAQKFPIYPTV
jgi:glycine hydroxymethyltransferase